MITDPVLLDEERNDREGSIYPLNSIFHHFDEEFQKLGDDKPATNVTGGSFAVVEDK